MTHIDEFGCYITVPTKILENYLLKLLYDTFYNKPVIIGHKYDIKYIDVNVSFTFYTTSLILGPYIFKKNQKLKIIIICPPSTSMCEFDKQQSEICFASTSMCEFDKQQSEICFASTLDVIIPESYCTPTLDN